MKGVRFRTWAALAALLLVPQLASSAGRGTLRVGVGLLEPTGSLAGSGETTFSIGVEAIFDVANRYRVEPRGGIGPFLGYELRLGDRVGLELAVSRVNVDLDVGFERDITVIDNSTGEVLTAFVESGGFRGDLDATFVTLGVHVHLMPGRAVDLYVGPLVGAGRFGGATFSPALGTVTIEVDDDLVVGAVAGADVPLGSGRWLVATSVRLLATAAQPERIPAVFRSKFFDVDDFAPGELALDPLEVRVGLARRFGG